MAASEGWGHSDEFDANTLVQPQATNNLCDKENLNICRKRFPPRTNIQRIADNQHPTRSHMPTFNKIFNVVGIVLNPLAQRAKEDKATKKD
jgi:hypothetical protein